ncbi:DUF4340 domain-containing protein [Nisaea acidiphila]|uniref:DUF4340 domain-containing protein n=1 Tax=Nisaea acidiphila TaxID=1862145 RepID=A0A9J7AMF3_9PROT|nr:DUF4340 domain-containing protein [Nisaea acidiphila]UUX48138.1 DUF4340 domain-containing protein [Nisaea acidiphila]
MLNLRTLGILAAVTGLVLLGAVVAVILRQDATVTALQDAPAFPGLEAQIPDIARIEMSWNKEGAVEQVTIAREEGVWRILEQGGYPADTGKVRDFILSLSELKLVEPKTADPARYDRLGVADVTEAGSEATRVRLLGPQEDVLADVLIGSERASGTGAPMVYIRPGDETRSWLALGRLDDVQRVTSWTENTVIDIGADRIQEIHLTGPDGKVLEIRRTGEGEKPFELMNMPEEREFATFYTMNEITDGLASLVFEEVRSMGEMAFEPSLGNAIYQTRSGLTVIVDFAETPGTDGEIETWAHFSINVAPDATEEAKSFADAHAQRLSQWAYRLSDSRLQRLRHTLETATKPAEEKPDAPKG